MAAVSFLPIGEIAKLQSFVRYATRTVSDGATTSSSTTVSSATAAFTSSDVGASISGGSIPNGATIVSITSGTAVVISSSSGITTGTGVALTITQTAALATPLLSTALNTAFGATAGNIQTFVDTTSGLTTQAVVISGDSTVFSVPLGSWVGYNSGAWTQYTAASLAAAFVQYFTT